MNLPNRRSKPGELDIHGSLIFCEANGCAFFGEIKVHAEQLESSLYFLARDTRRNYLFEEIALYFDEQFDQPFLSGVTEAKTRTLFAGYQSLKPPDIWDMRVFGHLHKLIKTFIKDTEECRNYEPGASMVINFNASDLWRIGYDRDSISHLWAEIETLRPLR